MFFWVDVIFIVDILNFVLCIFVVVVDVLLWMIVFVVEIGIIVVVDFIIEGERGLFWFRWGE